MTTKTKAFYKSKEFWVGIFAIYNVVANSVGFLPHIEPTAGFLAAVVGLMTALRLFFTESKLALRTPKEEPAK